MPYKQGDDEGIFADMAFIAGWSSADIVG